MFNKAAWSIVIQRLTILSILAICSMFAFKALAFWPFSSAANPPPTQAYALAPLSPSTVSPATPGMAVVDSNGQLWTSDGGVWGPYAELPTSPGPDAGVLTSNGAGAAASFQSAAVGLSAGNVSTFSPAIGANTILGVNLAETALGYLPGIGSCSSFSGGSCTVSVPTTTTACLCTVSASSAGVPSLMCSPSAGTLTFTDRSATNIITKASYWCNQ